MKGGPFGEKKILEKKIHNAEKLKGGGTFWGYSTSILSQNIKKFKGEKFLFSEKISQCRKKLKGGPFGLARYGMLRGKTGKTFLVQFAGANGAIWCNNIF